jgi:hypothetical protein
MMKLDITALRYSDLVSHCPLLSVVLFPVVLFRAGYHTSDPHAGLGGRLPLEPVEAEAEVEGRRCSGATF